MIIQPLLLSSWRSLVYTLLIGGIKKELRNKMIQFQLVKAITPLLSKLNHFSYAIGLFAV